MTTRTLAIWTHHMAVDEDPSLSSFERETASYTLYLFRVIEHAPDSTKKVMRVIELIYYLLARPSIFRVRPMFAAHFHAFLKEWIDHAEKETAILGVMTSLCVGIMQQELQRQLMYSAHCEHLKDIAARLGVLCRQALIKPTQQAEAH